MNLPQQGKLVLPKATIIKFSILSISLFVEAVVFLNEVIAYINLHDYFSISLEFSIKIVLLMLLTVYTLSLTIGAWSSWWQHLITTTVLVTAIFITLIKYDLTYALIISAISFLLLTYDNLKSYRIKKLLIKFDPMMILRFSTKGVLFIFSVVAGILLILNANGLNGINVGKKIAEVASDPLKSFVQKNVENQISQQLLPLKANGIDLEDPTIKQTLQQSGIVYESLDLVARPENVSKDIPQIIENQVNNFLEPYKNLFYPVMALLVFGLFQLYASITYWVYMATIKPLFYILIKTKFLKIEKVPAEQEIVSL